MNFKDRPIVVVDLETMGLEPQNHDIIDIGAIKLDQDFNEYERFGARIHPRRPFNFQPEALAVNGYNAEDWLDSLAIYDVMPAFAKFAQDAILISWSIKFEYSFLAEAHKFCNLPDAMDYYRYCFDVPSIVWWLYGDQMDRVSMNSTARLLGMPEEPRPHRAITGAQYALDILRKIRPQKEKA